MITIREFTLRLIRKVGLMPTVNVLGNCWFAVIKRTARFRGMNDIDVVYGKKYFDAETQMTSPSAASVVESLLAVFPTKSVVDIGCGTGVYLREFEKRGVNVKGYEGSSHAIAAAEIDQAKIVQCDFKQPLLPDRQYDLVISFEVAEHIESRYSDIFVQNVASFGNLIVFSAAQPGQGGVDHVNEQLPEYWIDKFQACGCTCDVEETRRIKESFRQHKSPWWLETNTLVFRR